MDWNICNKKRHMNPVSNAKGNVSKGKSNLKQCSLRMNSVSCSSITKVQGIQKEATTTTSTFIVVALKSLNFLYIFMDN